MAYADQPYGFIPIRHKSGAPYNGASRPYWIDNGATEDNFIGDPMILDGSANSVAIDVPGMGKFAIGTLPGVIRASAGTGSRVTGVVVAFGADTRDSTVYRVNSTERLVWLADDPELVFSVQADAAYAVDDIGRNSNILFDTTGSTSTGRSGAEADATASTGATAQLMVVGFVHDAENEANAVGNRIEVIFALHTLGTAGGMVGI